MLKSEKLLREKENWKLWRRWNIKRVKLFVNSNSVYERKSKFSQFAKHFFRWEIIFIVSNLYHFFFCFVFVIQNITLNRILQVFLNLAFACEIMIGVHCEITFDFYFLNGICYFVKWKFLWWWAPAFSTSSYFSSLASCFFNPKRRSSSTSLEYDSMHWQSLVQIYIWNLSTAYAIEKKIN